MSCNTCVGDWCKCGSCWKYQGRREDGQFRTEATRVDTKRVKSVAERVAEAKAYVASQKSPADEAVETRGEQGMHADHKPNAIAEAEARNADWSKNAWKGDGTSAAERLSQAIQSHREMDLEESAEHLEAKLADRKKRRGKTPSGETSPATYEPTRRGDAIAEARARSRAASANAWRGGSK